MINPYMIIGAIAFAVVAFFEGIHYQKLQDTAEIARLNELARQHEQVLADEVNQHAKDVHDANEKADKDIAKLNADLATQRVRFSISAVQPSEASGTTTGAGGQTRCDIDPEAAQSLVAIAADGDKAIRQLNALIDFYNQARSEQ
jgi:hypothetical protein